MMPGKFVWFWHRWIAIFADSRPEFVFGEQRPVLRRFVLDFVDDVEVNLSIESSIECIVEHIPQTVESKTRLSIMSDGFDGREFSSLYLVHQFPGTMTFICNFWNFVIEEWSLSVFDSLLEFLPILETSWRSVDIERTAAIFHPPLFAMFRYSWFFCIFCPHIINYRTKLLDDLIQFIGVFDASCIQTFEVWNDIFNESWFLVAFRSQD